MKLELRKFTKFVDKTFIEGGKEAKEPVLLVSVAAVFKNPWDGQGFVEDLKPTILDLAPKLGDILVPELIKEIGSPSKKEVARDCISDHFFKPPGMSTIVKELLLVPVTIPALRSIAPLSSSGH